MAARARECLALSTPAEPVDVSLEMSRAAYQALIGAIDCARQFVIESLLDRDPLLGEDLSVDDVAYAVYAGWRTGDHRWLAAILGSASPFEFDFRFATFKRGMEELTRARWLTAHEDAFRFTAVGERLATSLAATVSYVALHAKRWTGQAWEPHHLVALRGLGTLWTVEFGERKNTPNVKLTSRTAEEVDLLMSTALDKWSAAGALPPAAPPAPSGADDRELAAALAAEAPAGATAFCRNCGRPLRPDDGFCRGCGRKVGR
jgi:hypothetical protein